MRKNVKGSGSSSSKGEKTRTQGSRTRTGCWACRDRGVKCNEQRPRCRECDKLNLSCHYGIRLQWMEDSLARGICHGRQRDQVGSGRRKAKRRMTSPSPTTLEVACTKTELSESRSPVFFLNTFHRDICYYLQTTKSDSYSITDPCHSGSTSSQDFGNLEYFDNDEAIPCIVRLDESGSTVQTQIVPYQASSRLIPGYSVANLQTLNLRDSLDGHILQYHNLVVFASTTLVDDENHNTHRFAIMPLVATSENILSAVLCISATKLAYGNDASIYKPRAVAHRHRVLTKLTETLWDINNDLTKWVEAAAVTFILCWCDIADQCRPTWPKHLMGLSAILELCPEAAHEDPQASMLFNTCRQYLVYHLVMARATYRANNAIPDLKETLAKYLGPKADSHMAFGGNIQIEFNQGFSNTLLLLINDICDLADLDDSSDPEKMADNQAQAAKMAIRIESDLQTLIQLPFDPDFEKIGQVGTNPPTFPETDDDFQRRNQSIISTCKAHRLAALLFLDEICALHFPLIVLETRANRITLIDTILSLIEDVCRKAHVTAALPIWPLFITACSVNEENRIRVLNILDHFQENRMFGSVAPACTVIENVWRQRDLSRDENPRKPLTGFPLLTEYTETSRARTYKRTLNRTNNKPSSWTGTKTPYPWEPAMFNLEGSILCLT